MTKFWPILANDSLHEWNVTPLFSTPVSVTFIQDDLCEKISNLCNSQQWREDCSDIGYGSQVTESINVLSDNAELKNSLKNICHGLLSGVFKYDTDIQITTSWFTKVNENGSSGVHDHCNSWYSCVIYFDEYDEQSSKIQFYGNNNAIDPGKVFEYNYFNSIDWLYSPVRGSVFVFPSKVRHRIAPNKNSKERYSLAFNIMPKGHVGTHDSSFNY